MNNRYGQILDHIFIHGFHLTKFALRILRGYQTPPRLDLVEYNSIISSQFD